YDADASRGNPGANLEGQKRLFLVKGPCYRKTPARKKVLSIVLTLLALQIAGITALLPAD
ncbi:hypothetical protein KI387_042734, partial [Taxus chinensis]